ncbi:MAG: hypothetical protein AABY15_02250 [Nanoarchaeota archaeon]
MLYIATVTYNVTEYMGETEYGKTKNHTVEAGSEEEAKEKIKNYYEKEKTHEYSIYYSVMDIEIFEHIA